MKLDYNLLDEGRILTTESLPEPVTYALVAGAGKDCSTVLAQTSSAAECEQFLLEQVDFTDLRGTQRWGFAYFDEQHNEPVVEGNDPECKQLAEDALFTFMGSGVTIMDVIGRPSCPEEEPKLVRPVRKQRRRWQLSTILSR